MFRTATCLALGAAVALLAAACSRTTPRQNAAEAADRDALETLRELPPLLGERYSCATVVRAANQLRALGKDRCLHVLSEYDEEPDRWDSAPVNVLVLCRVLFVIPNDRQPGLGGELGPRVDRSKTEAFPLFPIAETDGVPFLLILGRNSGAGETDPGEAAIATCAQFPLVESGLPVTGFKEAAVKLAKSQQFAGLYLYPQQRSEMADQIMAQATKGERKSDPP